MKKRVKSQALKEEDLSEEEAKLLNAEEEKARAKKRSRGPYRKATSLPSKGVKMHGLATKD